MDLLYKLNWRLLKAREYPGIHQKVKELREEGNLSPHKWRALRNRRLYQLLAFCREHVSFYRPTLKHIELNENDNEIAEKMNGIPLMTKATIRQRLDDLMSDKVDRSRIIENATGGSTGVPLKFYQDQAYQTMAVAIDACVREWWGIKPYDRVASVWGADREFRELSFKERIYQYLSNTKSLNAFRMTEQSLLEFCHELKKWHAPYLMGYSSALEALARCAQKNDIHDLKFKAIRSSAEILWPHQRTLIHECFNSPVYNFYGSREVNNIAAECPEENRLHMISAWRYIEVVDGEGQPVPDGESGYIVVTDLTNYTMPFIRYRNEDMGRISKELCPCGRPSPVLEEILGRSTDLIRTPKGNIIHGEFFTHLFYGQNEIRQFQVHQKSLDHIILRYIANTEPSEALINKITGKIRAQIGENVRLDIEACNEIPLLASGKHRFTISDVRETDIT